MKTAYWYAVQFDPTDEWGTGSYDFDEAVRMLRKMYPEDEYPDACIAAIANGAYRFTPMYGERTGLHSAASSASTDLPPCTGNELFFAFIQPCIVF